MGALRSVAGATAALALALSAAACGEDGHDTRHDSTPAATTTAAGEPTSDAVTYPLTLTDMLGRSVTIDAEPRVVAAISPTAVEFVYAVGGTSVTRTTSVDFPEEAVEAVDVGSAYQPNSGLIAVQEPDLIIADAVLQPQIEADLTALGVPVLYAGASTFNDVLEGLRLVGEALNRKGDGASAALALQTKLEEIRGTLPADAPRVLVLNGAPQDFFAAKPESYVGDLVAQLNAENIATGQPDGGRVPGYARLGPEVIVAFAPDVVLAITQGPPGEQTLSDMLTTDATYASLPAVQSGAVHEIDADVYQQAPGPRAGQALDELAELLYPDIFGT
jgi:iron complex transport system substrate-binding protein